MVCSEESVTKVCTKCKGNKSLADFQKSKRTKDGYSTQCKECLNVTKTKYNKSPKKKKCDERYRERHPDRIQESMIKFKKTDHYHEYYEGRKAWRVKRDKERRKDDPIYKISFNLRVRVRSAVQAQGSPRFYKFDEYIGCTPEFLKQYLEGLFKVGMSWNNYGIKGWHIDHILPCDSFNLFDPNEQKKCFHYTNLQPLWWYENTSKSNRILVA